MDDAKADATDYVAVIATMPPAAPAKEWIVESPGIVGSRNEGEGDKLQFDLFRLLRFSTATRMMLMLAY